MWTLPNMNCVHAFNHSNIARKMTIKTYAVRSQLEIKKFGQVTMQYTFGQLALLSNYLIICCDLDHCLIKVKRFFSP